MDISQRIYNGNRAKEVLENESFIDAFESIKKEIRQQWENSPARDTEGREKLYAFLKIAEKFEQTLKTTLETGRLAEIELNHRKTLVERAREMIG